VLSGLKGFNSVEVIGKGCAAQKMKNLKAKALEPNHEKLCRHAEN
jgi:hypothetical protein